MRHPRRYLVLFLFFFFGLFLLEPLWAKELPVHLNAEYLKYDEDEEMIIATGEVKIEMENFVLHSDSLRFDMAANILTAEGNVRFEVLDRYLAQADSLFYNVTSAETEFRNFHTILTPSRIKGKLFLSSNSLHDQEKRMDGKNGKMTTCDYGRPHYQIMAQWVELYPGDKVVGYNVTFWVGRVPVLWAPVYIYSLQKKRQHFPEFGHNEVEGDYIKTTWDYFINNNALGVAFLDYMSRKGWGYGFAHEYQLDNRQSGELSLYHVDEIDTHISDWVTGIKYNYQLDPKAVLSLGSKYSYRYLVPSGRSDYTENSVGFSNQNDGSLAVNYRQKVNRYNAQGEDNFNFSRSVKSINTNFSYTNYRLFSGYSHDTGNLSYGDQAFFMPNLNMATNVSYIKDMSSREAVPDERADPALTFAYKGPFYTLTESQNWYLDLDGNRFVADNNVEYVTKQPEVAIAFNPYRWQGINLTPSLGVGWFTEAKMVPSLGKMRVFSTHRYAMNLGADWSNDVGLGSKLNLIGSAQQLMYDPGDAQYSLSGGAILGSDWFSFIRNSFEYKKIDTQGGSPFFFDKLGAYSNYWKEVLTFYYLQYFDWKFTGGYNYLINDYDDVLTKMVIRPAESFRLQFDTGYRIEEKQYRELATTLHWEPIKRWVFDFRETQDLNLGQIKTANLSSDLELGDESNWYSHWKIQMYHEYDVFAQQFYMRDITVIKDLHCWNFKFSYSDYRKSASFAFVLKALPDEPMGFSPEKGFYMETFEKEKSAFMKDIPYNKEAEGRQ